MIREEGKTMNLQEESIAKGPSYILLWKSNSFPEAPYPRVGSHGSSLAHRSLAKAKLLSTRTHISESQRSVLSTVPPHLLSPVKFYNPLKLLTFAIHQIFKKRLTQNNEFVIIGKISCEHRRKYQSITKPTNSILP